MSVMDTGITRPFAVDLPVDLSRVQGRLAALTDGGSFTELGSQALHRTTAFGMARKLCSGDGVVTGLGSVDGRELAIFAQDPDALGGSLGEVHASKIERVMRHAGRCHMPVLGLLDSGGARIQEGVLALDGYGSVFRMNVALSGRVPQLSVVLGPCAGGAAYSPALTDLVIMARDRAYMFVTGPAVVKAVTSEDVTAEELGGADMHHNVSGVVHLVAADEGAALLLARHALSYLPNSCDEPPPIFTPGDPEPMPTVPENPRHSYDVRGVIRGVVDGNSFLELQSGFAKNLVIGFARIMGRSVGVVANQPEFLAGTLNVNAAEKGARFVRMCDAFGLPIVTFVDTPGYLPGRDEEQAGIIRKGAKLLYAYAEATVPRVTIILRKAFGGAYIVMNSKSLGADAVFAWPNAEIAVMGAEGAISVICRRQIAEQPHLRDELIDEYRSVATAVQVAAERTSVDEIIRPDQTRSIICATLASLAGSWRPGFRHDNLPQ